MENITHTGEQHSSFRYYRQTVSFLIKNILCNFTIVQRIIDGLHWSRDIILCHNPYLSLAAESNPCKAYLATYVFCHQNNSQIQFIVKKRSVSKVTWRCHNVLCSREFRALIDYHNGIFGFWRWTYFSQCQQISLLI